jgi:catechol 2,3-dioxygenase-like lactoylglutathione lyase family enzyme
MLQEQERIAFVATRDAARSKAFYADALGLRFVADPDDNVLSLTQF